jgi:hypothetical protein
MQGGKVLSYFSGYNELAVPKHVDQSKITVTMQSGGWHNFTREFELFRQVSAQFMGVNSPTDGGQFAIGWGSDCSRKGVNLHSDGGQIPIETGQIAIGSGSHTSKTQH